MNKSRLSFYDEIERNKRSSYILIFVILMFLLSLVYVISALIAGEAFWIILIFGTIISIMYVYFGYRFSDKIALASVNAKPADEYNYRQYHHLVEGLCLASGLPKPRLYVMESPSINAFASGRDPKNSVICVTTGALEKLNKQELEGVLAHEISHIANYDIRFMTLTAVLVGMISIISQIFLRSLFWSSLSRNGNSRGSDARLRLILILIGIILAIIAPIVTMLVQLAISRKREYAADSTAVKFTRTPTGLIGALTKIKDETASLKVSGAISPLFIAKPKKTREWFSTHPPLEERIERLKRM